MCSGAFLHDGVSLFPTAVCDDSFHDKWKTIAKLVGFQVNEIDECSSASSHNKKAQSIAFLKRWSKRDGLNMIKRIPLALADEKLYWIKKADLITLGIFGEYYLLCKHA